MEAFEWEEKKECTPLWVHMIGIRLLEFSGVLGGHVGTFINATPGQCKDALPGG